METVNESAESITFLADLGTVWRLPDAEHWRLFDEIDPTGDRGASPREMVELWRRLGRPFEAKIRSRLALIGIVSDEDLAGDTWEVNQESDDPWDLPTPEPDRRILKLVRTHRRSAER